MNLFCRFIRWLFCKDNPMSVQLSPIGNAAQFFTVNGAPLNAGQLFTYAAGTSTPQATFTSSAGSIQNANPIILGVDGRPPNEVWLSAGIAYKFVLEDSTNAVLGTYDNISGIPPNLIVNSYLTGLTMSAAQAASSVSVAAGQATDSTNVLSMSLSSSISKTTSGWAVGTGNGGLDTGSSAQNTWYHFYLIYRSDTGVTDIIFSLSATGPTLPTSYTNFRRIGAAKTRPTDATTWMGFVQDGDYFQWITPVSQGGGGAIGFDFSSNNPGTSAITQTLPNVPSGVHVLAQLKITLFNADAFANACNFSASDLATNDGNPNVTPGMMPEIFNIATAANLSQSGYTQILVRTDTSARIRWRVDFSTTDVTVRGGAIGWFDSRGRNAG